MPEQNQPITTLPIKTASGMAATDYLLGIDSAEGYQMLIQDLGDYIIQHALSNLDGSSQTVAGAVSKLSDKNTVIVLPLTNVASNNDIYALYNARSNGESFRQKIVIASSFSSLPPGNHVLEGYRNSVNYGWLRLYTYSEPYATVYSNVKSNGTWSGWGLVPTRAEVDSINSKLTVEYENVTYTNNVNTSSSDNYTYIKKYGSLVNINFQVKLNSSITGISVITLPSDLYPSITSRGFSFIVSTDSQKYCGVSSTYGVYVNGLSEWAGKLILGSITYLIN